ncbi:hypothetical protein DLAC_00815 [Tieghemostelium lacteum]|uniref:Uncharacterized protein n=1 Tax=Tieghemostelium lacteum TaxID=361077 RepID=A0A152A7C3_TIELA|nr:hypothetical protein DLAC_00815 [Tieghemostelium lacteum]|eukprot:KYR02021.1 hypothetical protein DLAC_00815 [Tieghemostelium lacteum]
MNKEEKIIGREKEIEEIQSILNRDKCIVIHGEDGTGKSSLVRYYYEKYNCTYKYMYEFTDLELGWMCNDQFYSFQQPEASPGYIMKKCVGDKVLVVVRNITHHSDAEIYEVLSKKLPLDKDSIQSMNSNHHIIIIRSQEFRELEHVTHYLLGNVRSDDDCTLLLKEYLEVDLTDAQMEMAKKITQGNPVFSKMLARYMNTIKKDTVGYLLEKLQSHQEVSQNELIRLILSHFQTDKDFNLELISYCCWFGPYFCNFKWLFKMFPNEKLDELKVFSNTMEYFGLWRQIKITENSIKIEPYRSSVKKVREQIDNPDVYFKMCLKMISALRAELYEFQYECLLLSRHVFYYLRSNEYRDNLNKAVILFIGSKVFDEVLEEPDVNTSLQWIEEALPLIKGTGDDHELLILLRIGELKSKPDIAKYQESLEHFRQVEHLNKIYEEKHKDPVIEPSSILLGIALCYGCMNRVEESIEIHKQILQLNADNEQAPPYGISLTFLSDIYYNLRNYRECLYYTTLGIKFAQNCELHDNVVMSRLIYTSAKCHYQLGNYEKSNQLIEKIKNMDIDSDKIDMYLNMYDNFVRRSKKPNLLKYIVTSSIVLTIASFIVYKYFKK